MKKLFVLSIAVLLFAGLSFAQSTSNVTLTVAPEASISLVSATGMSTTLNNNFQAFTGTTSITYSMRTMEVGGNGSLVVKFTTEFNGDANGIGGPRIADLTFQGTDAGATSSPAGIGSTLDQPVFGYGTDYHANGAGATVLWTLPNYPSYKTGLYTAVATFTLSAA